MHTETRADKSWLNERSDASPIRHSLVCRFQFHGGIVIGPMAANEGRELLIFRRDNVEFGMMCSGDFQYHLPYIGSRTV